jgi:hypothetical protein
METKYRVSLQIGTIGFTIESTDKDWVEAKEKQYLDEYLKEALRREPLKIDLSGAIEKEKKIPPISPSISINEFYRQYVKGNKIESRPNIAVFMVYFLEKILKKDEITSADITKCFGEISYPDYNKLNMTDILNQAKRKALLNYVNNFWKLTITGEDFVLNTISSEK